MAGGFSALGFSSAGFSTGGNEGVLATSEEQDVAFAVGYAIAVEGALAATEEQDVVAFAVGFVSSVSLGVFDPVIHLTDQRLDLDATAQALAGDASATLQTKLGVAWVELAINDLYSAIMPLNPLYRDAVGVSDSAPVIDFGNVIYDSVQMLDEQAIDRARTSTEDVAALDVFALAVVWIRAFSDQVDAQDAIHVLAPSGSIFSESVTVADLTSRIVAIQKGEPVPVVDLISVGLVPRPYESAIVTDVLSRVVAYRRTFGDVATATDQMAIATAKPLATPVSVADQKYGGWGKSLADGLFTADVQTRILGKGPADTVAVADAPAVSVTFRRTLADTVYATDIFSTITNDLVQFSDAVTMTDSRVRALTKPHIESVTLTDGRATSLGKPVADTVGLASAGVIVGQGYANNYFAEDYVSGTLVTFT